MANGDVYALMRFFDISSNWFSLSIFSTLCEERLTADRLILSLAVISTVLSPSFRLAQKHNSPRVLTVCDDLPNAVTSSGAISSTSATLAIARSKS